jgi:predicted secreted Zn-dependent protease
MKKKSVYKCPSILFRSLVRSLCACVLFTTSYSYVVFWRVRVGCSHSHSLVSDWRLVRTNIHKHKARCNADANTAAASLHHAIKSLLPYQHLEEGNQPVCHLTSQVLCVHTLRNTHTDNIQHLKKAKT